MRTLRARLLATAALAAACSGGAEPTPLTVGDFLFEHLGGARFRIASSSNPARTILESAPAGVDENAPAAAGVGDATIRALYGAFRFDDVSPTRWSAAAKLTFAATVGGGATLTFKDAAGKLVLTANASAPAGRPGALALAIVPAAGANRFSLAFACAADDRFLGFGAQADALDHHGHTIPIFTSEPGIGKSSSDDPSDFWFVEGTRHASSYAMPVWLSQRGYVGALASDGRSVFELCSKRADVFRVEAWSTPATLHLYDGPAPKTALERAGAGVLGRSMRPPAVAFAPWNDALFGSARVREVAALLRAKKLPSSVIWTEDFRGGEPVGADGYRLKEEWRLDRTLYPEAESVASELRAQGFAWHAYFNTFLVKDTHAFGEAMEGGHFVKKADDTPYLFQGATFLDTGLVDLSRPATREWMKGYLRLALDAGFDGWMADFGEWLPPDAKLASGEDALASAHNRYAHEWALLNAEVLAERASDGRQRVFFARAGWFGTAAKAPVVWAGDQRTSFLKDDGLFTVIPMGLGLGLVGVSTYAHDIGGYQSAIDPPATKELFFRWTSLGALSPVMRTHHGTKPALQWWFGKDEETIAHYGRWARLHVRLFPYLDGSSLVAETTTTPIFRALALEFPDDPLAWTIPDQYLLGPSILVAPVVDAGATSRRVHFPKGSWLPLFGGAPVAGPSDADVAAPLTALPAFVRAGSVLPLLAPEIDTLLPAAPPVVDLAAVQARRTLWWFTGGAGAFSERGGARYESSGAAIVAAGPASFREGTQSLTACASEGERGCVESVDAAARRAVVRLQGAGPLEADGARLVIDASTATPAVTRFDVEVRW